MTKHLLVITFIFILSACAFANTDKDPNNNLPPNKNVELTESNLPILVITTNGVVFSKSEYKKVKVCLIRNKGNMNYADTVAHSGQKYNYIGYALLKYHGNSSFSDTDKPPFTMKLCDANGVSQKASLLGMGKAKKWQLSAPFMDRSLIREKFIFESFRPFFDFVPDCEPVEVMIDGIYRGIYYITEKVGLNKNRIDSEDPMSVGEDEMTGGYVVKVDRGDETYTANNGSKYNAYYTSKYYISYKGFIKTYYRYVYYNYVEPDIEDLVDKGVGNKTWIDGRIASFEDELKSGRLTYVDINSFAAYMLATEFGRNVDGYRLSTYLYKYRDSIDKRFKMTLWDFDRSLGNSKDDNASNASTWSYKFNDRHSVLSEDIFVPFYWETLMKNDDFINEAKILWTMMRRSTLSNENIENRINELHNILAANGAQARNDKAYNIWTRGYIKPITDTQKEFTSVIQEISYIKSFITNRLKTMDTAFLLKDKVIPGDVNNDGKVTIADVARTISYITFGNKVDFNRIAADANLDGKIDMDDVEFIAQSLITA